MIPNTVWALRDGALITVDLPPPTDDDVDTIVRDSCRRFAAHIERRTADGTLAALNTAADFSTGLSAASPTPAVSAKDRPCTDGGVAPAGQQVSAVSGQSVLRFNLAEIAITYHVIRRTP